MVRVAGAAFVAATAAANRARASEMRDDTAGHESSRVRIDAAGRLSATVAG